MRKIILSSHANIFLFSPSILNFFGEENLRFAVHFFSIFLLVLKKSGASRDPGHDVPCQVVKGCIESRHDGIGHVG